MSHLNQGIVNLWHFCHEEHYLNQDIFYAMLASGELLRVNQAEQLVEQVAPASNWKIDSLPMLHIVDGKSVIEQSGIVVDQAIAIRLREFTTSLLGTASDETRPS